MIKRVTITIKPDVLKRIDKMKNRNGIRNRSHAVEHLILKSLGKTDLNTAMILAGGAGTSLRPITYEIPKPLIPIHGRPILEHQIAMLKNNNIDNILLSVGYMRERIKEYFGNGSKFGVDITYIEEDKPIGTGGPLTLAKDYIKDSFVLMNVDTLMNPDIEEIYEFHKNEGRLVTILLATTDNPCGFGVVRLRGKQVTEFVEKPQKARSNIINAGFYIVEPDVLKIIPKGRFMIEHFFNKLAKRGQISGFMHDGVVFDVGTHDGYARAIKEWKPSH